MQHYINLLWQEFGHRHLRTRQRVARSPSSPEGGLTLIEVTIVVVLIGIISAIAYPSYLNFRDRAQYAKARMLLKEMGHLLNEYAVLEGGYPGDSNRNTQPAGLSGTWYVAADMPFISSTDYEHWGVGGGECVVAITWMGKNQVRESPVHRLPPPSGQSPAIGDDVVLTVNRYACPGVGRGPIR